jgi:hypothetical protein
MTTNDNTAPTEKRVWNYTWMMMEEYDRQECRLEGKRLDGAATIKKLWGDNEQGYSRPGLGKWALDGPWRVWTTDDSEMTPDKRHAFDIVDKFDTIEEARQRVEDRLREFHAAQGETVTFSQESEAEFQKRLARYIRNETVLERVARENPGRVGIHPSMYGAYVEEDDGEGGKEGRWIGPPPFIEVGE